jgi:hypothetical protein
VVILDKSLPGCILPLLHGTPANPFPIKSAESDTIIAIKSGSYNTTHVGSDLSWITFSYQGAAAMGDKGKKDKGNKEQKKKPAHDLKEKRKLKNEKKKKGTFIPG